jgi:hypothetical protein
MKCGLRRAEQNYRHVKNKISPALRIPLFPRAFVIGASEQLPCTNFMISTSVERWVCSGISIAVNNARGYNIVVEHTGPNAIPVAIDANVQVGVGDFRPSNNSISETHLVPY